MGRAPCCDKANVKRGPWSPDEDTALKNYVEQHGTGGNWISLPHKAGLRRCGKSCRLRWLNYLRPDIKHGGFTEEEDNIICTLYKNMGSRWSVIASHLSGRTDNDVKNYWNTKLKKKFLAAKTSPSNNDTISSKKTDEFNCSFSTPITETSTNSLPCGEFGFGYNMDYQKLFQKPISSPLLAPVAFGLSTNKHSFSTSMQDIPGSGLGSLPSDSNWPGNGGGEFDSFLMEMGYGSPHDFPNGYGFQEKIGEAAPNSGFGYASFLANGDEKPQGRYQSVTY